MWTRRQHHRLAQRAGFMPVDVNPDAMEDEWSGDIGCGVKYFSQDGVIKLAPRAGINLSESLSPAEKLKEVQKLMDQGGSPAEPSTAPSACTWATPWPCTTTSTASSMCCCWVASCPAGGGDIILDTCKKVLADEYRRWPAS